MKFAAFLCAVGLAAVAPTPLPRPFGRGYATMHVTAFAPYAFENTVLRLRFDVARGIVYGDEVATVRAKHASLASLPFNSAGIAYRRITVNGKPAAFTLDAARESIDVRLPAPVAAGTRLVVEFVYQTHPQRGVYFIRPDKAYPNVTPEIWTQGETTDNRSWFPTWDEPNEKTPSELIVTVPRGWTVVANGYLKAHALAASSETWDWNAPRRKSTYLIAFAAGPLAKHHTTLGQATMGNVAHYGNGSLDVDSFVQPPDADLNAICFGRTNDMVAYLQQIAGVKYPFEKYDQITAERFTFGGMENASATILTDRALHPAIEEPESSCDVLVSHELAQHWFGDDVTMADWSNAWINEGFATYYHQLWGEKDNGEASFEYDRYQAQQAYFAETRRYFRPIVEYVYTDALELFDVSGHERPAQALHMLRHLFGDARFFKAQREYLLAYEDKNADTHQYFAAIGKSLGTDLTWFEDEWFYRAAYPHYVVTDRYDAASQTLTLDVRQQNRDGRPFRMPVAIEAVAGGVSHAVTPLIDRNEQTVTIANLPSKPQMVLFDPNNDILRELTFEKSADELAYQLVNAAHVGDREWALNQPGTPADAVKHAARSDAFYGVRADAVAVAARLGDGDTVDASLHDADKRVRIAAEKAAGTLKASTPALIRDLETMADDEDANVAAAALTSLGALKADGAYDRLVTALQRPSFRQGVAIGALGGLAALGDAKALPLLQERTAYGTPEPERNAAVVAFAQLAARANQSQTALLVLLQLGSHD
ncbi:MAG TPA: M1 family aminopeptidase, partial [Candidatus Acidoferrales bacterium]|nr:M1 family aminopeptidase [Candidatus Acidoferrales bacterium]